LSYLCLTKNKSFHFKTNESMFFFRYSITNIFMLFFLCWSCFLKNIFVFYLIVLLNFTFFLSKCVIWFYFLFVARGVCESDKQGCSHNCQLYHFSIYFHGLFLVLIFFLTLLAVGTMFFISSFNEYMNKVFFLGFPINV
jgi:hypothetical protein